MKAPNGNFSKKGGTRPPSPRKANSRGSSPAVGRFAPSGLPSLFPRLIEMIRQMKQAPLLFLLFFLFLLFPLFFPTNLWAIGGNGLSGLTLLPAPASPFVCIRVVTRSGAIDDPKGKEGLAWLTAQVVSAGGSRARTRQEVLRKIYPMAASFYGHCDKEITSYVGVVHRNKLDEFYALFSEILLHPRFDTSDVSRERDNGINYLKNNLRATNDEELGKQVLDQEIHRNHPYGHATPGTINGLQAISITDIQKFHVKSMEAGRVSIGIAGNYPADFPERLKKDFNLIADANFKPSALPPREPISNLQVTLVSKPCDAAAISIGFPVDITRADKDFFPLLVADAFFGDHRTFVGRLQKNMRVARGLNYGNYSYIEHFIQGVGRFAAPGIPRRAQEFSIWIRPVKPEHAHFALRQAIRELKLLVEKGMTDPEVREYKQYVLCNYPLWAQTLDRRLGYLIDSKFYGLDDFLKEIENQVSRLRTADVNNAIKRHLQWKNLQAVIVTDHAEALEKAISQNATSPITYGKTTISPALEAEDKEIMAFPLEINPDRIRIVPASSLFETAEP